MESALLEYGPLAGYLVLLLFSFIEGESVVLTAGYFSYKGYLSLPLIMFIAFMGTLCADQLSFYIGRKYGPNLLIKKPSLRKKSDKIFKLMHRYNTVFILGFRFIYGIRIASPFIIGASGFDPRRFAILNVIAAAIWSVLSCWGGYLIGYYFSDNIEDVIHTAMRYQKITVASIITIIIVIFIWTKYYRKSQVDTELSIDHDQVNR